jgi:hypothetical protein
VSLPACLFACLPVCLPACLPVCLSACLPVAAVVFFGQRKMEESVKWMGAFWASIAGERLDMLCSMHAGPQPGLCSLHGLPILTQHRQHPGGMAASVQFSHETPSTLSLGLVAALCCVSPQPPSPCCPAAGIASFATVSPLAAALFAPTQVWVTVAAKLNYDIVALNRGDAKKSS